MCARYYNIMFTWTEPGLHRWLFCHQSDKLTEVIDQSHKSLRWRHNERDSVSNHQPHDCLLSRLFRRRSKKTSKLRVTGLCVGNSPGTGEFPAQMASYAENVSIWWRHHVSQCSCPHPTMQHWATDKCTRMNISVTTRCIVLYLHCTLHRYIVGFVKLGLFQSPSLVVVTSR